MSKFRMFTGAALTAALLALTAGWPAGAGAMNPEGAAPIGNVTIDDPLAPGHLYLRAVPGGVIDTATLHDARNDRVFQPDRRYIVQLDGPITPQRQQRLEAANIALNEYIPAFAYLADLSQTTPRTVAAVDFIIWVGHWRDEWKLDPELGLRPGTTPERQVMIANGQIPVYITLFQGTQREATFNALQNLNPPADVHFATELAGNPLLSATINIDQVAALAAVPDVQFVEEAPDITTRNNNVRWVVQANTQGYTPLYDQGLMGQGQIAGVLDTRLDRNHCSFVDSEPIGPNHRKILAYNTSFGTASHGTHVSGTIVGDAGSDSHTRGVAYLGRLVYNTWPSFNEAAIHQSFTQHHNQGARIHTNSWGDDGTTAYNGLCRGIDSFQWDFEDSQTFWAVTNTNTLKNPENAKNTLAVGATSPPPSQDNHCTGGSGPTSDGRRKPEIYAPGCQTISANPGTCNTGSSSGTSMASPAVAGAGMLVRQYFMDGYYPLGMPEPGLAFTPSGALVKATLLNSTAPMNGPFPGNQQGWGRVKAADSLYFFGDERGLVVFDVRNADGLTTGQSAMHEVTVTGSQETLNVTLVWTEPPGASGTSFASVNDLDLIVSGPNGVFKGNVFQNGVSAPGGNKDDRNNVEQVRIPNPGPGLWTIEVAAAAVNQHAQGYALVVSGEVATEEPPLTVMLPNGAPTMVDPGAPVQFNVRIIPGQENVEPGTEMLYYRFAPGSEFIGVPLVHVEDDIYTATLPACTCADTPQFYVTATGDKGTVRSAPANAPASFYTAGVGHIETNEVFYQDFADGMPAGWSTTGIWHISSACTAPGSGECAPVPGGQWAYYGQSTGSNACTYNVGSTNSGAMQSSSITFPSINPGDTMRLKFCYNLVTENHNNYDIAMFRVLNTSVEQRMPESTAWTQFSIDVTALAGQSRSLQWHFNTVDNILNNFRGWQVDRVRLEVTGLVCEDPDDPSILGDLNGDGLVGVADLLILLGEWGACADCQDCPADLDGDCGVGVADLLILLGNWG